MSYPGGKGASWRHIVSRMPRHRLYIEPFLGAGSVMRNKRPAERSIGIDADARATQFALLGWVSKVESKVEILLGDALPFLRRWPWEGDELVYADPPYPFSVRRGQRYYAHEFGETEQHEDLLEVLREIPAPVMLSGYRCELYDDVLVSWRREDFHVGTHGGGRIESLWMNFTARGAHDLRHVGDNYRERERIKRKIGRWRARFAALPDGERDAMLRELLATSPPARAVEALIDTHGKEVLDAPAPEVDLLELVPLPVTRAAATAGAGDPAGTSAAPPVSSDEGRPSPGPAVRASTTTGGEGGCGAEGRV